ncbi:hypothetical protein GCM10010349_78550 [Streptomyces flavofungini]|nr:hypothetical protein GCM10010349_78550 [Streptomyces flavofungini]
MASSEAQAKSQGELLAETCGKTQSQFPSRPPYRTHRMESPGSLTAGTSGIASRGAGGRSCTARAAPNHLESE